MEDALVKLGGSLEFGVIVIDHSQVLGEQADRPIDDPDFKPEMFPFSASDSVVVLTKGGRGVEILQALSMFNLRYVGLLASVQRAKDDLAKLREGWAGGSSSHRSRPLSVPTSAL